MNVYSGLATENDGLTGSLSSFLRVPGRGCPLTQMLDPGLISTWAFHTAETERDRNWEESPSSLRAAARHHWQRPCRRLDWHTRKSRLQVSRTPLSDSALPSRGGLPPNLLTRISGSRADGAGLGPTATQQLGPGCLIFCS